jgi:hypothetical protein
MFDAHVAIYADGGRKHRVRKISTMRNNLAAMYKAKTKKHA